LNSEEQPAFTAAEPPQAVERIQSGTRPDRCLIDARSLRRGNSFGATVEETGLKHADRESRVAFAKGASDRVLTTGGEVEPRCDVDLNRCQCLLVKSAGSLPMQFRINRFGVDKDAGNGLKRDASTLIGE
jgi:hypothetical protein